MAIEWEEEFDVVCGAKLTSSRDEPLADSGVWDLLHGPREVTAADRFSFGSRPRPFQRTAAASGAVEALTRGDKLAGSIPGRDPIKEP